MPYTHSRIPADARAWPSFDLIKGLGKATHRLDFAIGSLVSATTEFEVSVGEPLRLLAGTGTSNQAFRCDPTGASKAEIVGLDATGDDRPLGIAWDAFNSTGRSTTSFPGANNSGHVTTLIGKFAARLSLTEWIATSDADLGAAGQVLLGVKDAASLVAIKDVTNCVGRDVVAVRTIAGKGKYMLLPMGYDVTLATPLTEAGATLMRSIVGKVIKQYTNPAVAGTPTYIEVLFDF
jgi:hypothetical protein